MSDFSLAEPPLFHRLRTATDMLIAGAGGGFDIYGGLPLAAVIEAHLTSRPAPRPASLIPH
ncbi:hypothetical protein OHB26_28085 [Nocardia sp. NBC_01503]|uniref:hypothetical protein n=1 Tax=Nocardia sp. NBC_01503 TaxID=2975997 RepID=UPI002E7AF011|nr:hypothetical protein [Nocardia sp. NBC_01503]WTL30766.1 hypothetical protein OHB26_28085 [Nocardia sp. NBC_01503]